jgi:hypothetical protein
MGFLSGADVTGFLVVWAIGFLAVVVAMGALRMGVVPGTAFLVPMGWATMLKSVKVLW